MKEKLSTLWAYISYQEEAISGIYKKIAKLRPSNDDKLVNLAYQMHNIYSSYEDLFKEIATNFENNIERSSGYHKNLLLRMKISIPGIRPGILSEQSFIILTELMSFRHVFRHAYSYNLSVDKVEALKNKILTYRPALESDIAEFKAFLEKGFNG
ncbi:MAG: hypothetical protein KJ607_07960 [Bacteroidetes bacterium]|nr:hypothetical protein [Bacteroidota bacterium]